ncbi:hypothetical protein NIES267_22170 [Calothrix parasitica NIES-267]|uniref:Uncharacterized protein n=1 Tax=Calothrix parasitica NIES-267 TaxID=1973488 RepID=A0A1Z4LNE7_9CYAN|nr:hypothetical protein NIES267_22170 [Calothrix parasitica NIES-267]
MAQFTIEELLITAKKIINDVFNELQNQCQYDEILEDINNKLEYITNDENRIYNCPSLEQLIEYENTLSEVLNEEIDFNDIEPL